MIVEYTYRFLGYSIALALEQWATLRKFTRLSPQQGLAKAPCKPQNPHSPWHVRLRAFSLYLYIVWLGFFPGQAWMRSCQYTEERGVVMQNLEIRGLMMVARDRTPRAWNDKGFVKSGSRKLTILRIIIEVLERNAQCRLKSERCCAEPLHPALQSLRRESFGLVLISTSLLPKNHG